MCPWFDPWRYHKTQTEMFGFFVLLLLLKNYFFEISLQTFVFDQKKYSKTRIGMIYLLINNYIRNVVLQIKEEENYMMKLTKIILIFLNLYGTNHQRHYS